MIQTIEKTNLVNQKIYAVKTGSMWLYAMMYFADGDYFGRTDNHRVQLAAAEVDYVVNESELDKHLDGMIAE